MRFVSTFIVALALAVTAAGCSSPMSPSEPATFTLGPGERARYGSLSVRFIEVSADSRCPGNALCISPGNATIQIDAQLVGKSPERKELLLLDPVRRELDYSGYTLELQSLDPYPFTFDPIEPDEYRLTFVVSSK